MDGFGYISASLSPGTCWNRCIDWLPETWRYRRGPVFAGKLNGFLNNTPLEGWGWQIPNDYRRIWNEAQNSRIWRRMRDEFLERRINVIGIEATEEINPFAGCNSPGISDGKTLELLTFITGFPNMLHKRGLTRNSEVLIVWEEGNLGLACARLVAREMRFITLVHPRFLVLEQAAAVIMTETGVSPKVKERLLPSFSKIPIVIQCGRLRNFNLIAGVRRPLIIKLFQNTPDWCPPLPLAAGLAGRMLSGPALAEAIIRVAGGIKDEHWFGSDVKLERVSQLVDLLQGLGIMALGNW